MINLRVPVPGASYRASFQGLFSNLAVGNSKRKILGFGKPYRNFFLPLQNEKMEFGIFIFFT